MRTVSRNAVRYAALFIAVTVLAACDPNPGDPGPGGVNAGDAKALDEAAKKLDERQTDPGKR